MSVQSTARIRGFGCQTATVGAIGGQYPSARVVPYDQRWPHGYAVAGALRTRLGPGWTIEHVGSTSVPGLAAKPVIDIAMCAPDGIAVHDLGAMFANLGWTRPEPVGDHLASYLLDDGIRRAISHIFMAEQWPDAHLRLFADWLRRHPEDRDAYAALKHRLISTGTWGLDYTNAKGDFVLAVVNQARAAQGLQTLADLDS